MFRPNIIERINHKIKDKTKFIFAKHNREKLDNVDFTIISNNCWGGICYEYFGIKKKSPTVGSFIMTDDYLNFIEKLDFYLAKELEIIPLNKSKHYEIWKDDLELKNVPIGRLGDVEIVFLHYKNPEVAKAKWNSRVQRINKENMIFKFSYMNGCTDGDIHRFIDMKLPGKKICFVKDSKTAQLDNSLVYYPGFEDSEQIFNDTYYWNKYVDVIKFINTGKVIPK